jgi:preprotein translocase subunit YajC
LAAAGGVAIGRVAAIFRAHFGRRSGSGRHRDATPPEALISMFITPAFAQGGSLLGGDSPLTSFMIPLIAMFAIMYFLILRPQQKRQKQHQEMIKNVRKGDTVVTSGGMVGKVTKVVDDDQVEVEVADGVRIRQMRSMLADVRAKGEPVKQEGASS